MNMRLLVLAAAVTMLPLGQGVGHAQEGCSIKHGIVQPPSLEVTETDFGPFMLNSQIVSFDLLAAFFREQFAACQTVGGQPRPGWSSDEELARALAPLNGAAPGERSIMIAQLEPSLQKHGGFRLPGFSGKAPAARASAPIPSARDATTSVWENIPTAVRQRLAREAAALAAEQLAPDLERVSETVKAARAAANDANALAASIGTRVGAVEQDVEAVKENVGNLAEWVDDLAGRQASLEQRFAAETAAQATVDAAQDERLAGLQAEFLEAFGLTEARLAAIDGRLLDLATADTNLRIDLGMTEVAFRQELAGVRAALNTLQSADTVTQQELQDAVTALDGSEIFARLLAYARDSAEERTGMSAGSLLGVLAALVAVLVLFFSRKRVVRMFRRTPAEANAPAGTGSTKKPANEPAVELDLQHTPQPDLTQLKEGEKATWRVPDKEHAAWYDIIFTMLADGRVQTNLRRDASTDAFLPPISPKRANVETKVREAARKGTLPKPSLASVQAA